MVSYKETQGTKFLTWRSENDSFIGLPERLWYWRWQSWEDLEPIIYALTCRTLQQE